VRTLYLSRVPQTGAVLFAVNHQSYLDPVLVGSPPPRVTYFMARRSLFVGLFGRIIRFVRAFPVDRDRADLQAVRESIGLLGRGQCVMIFPEGTRSRDGRIGALRAGFGMLARRAGAPILPVYIDGAYRAWPRHHLLPKPVPIRVWYGRPMAVGAVEDERVVVQRVEAALRALEAEASAARARRGGR
jgi:1-acyl-sn-glycerol-3-phosphate acyltransferase